MIKDDNAYTKRLRDEKDMHLIGGDLDTKKAPAEKNQLLIEYFMLKNKLESDNKKSDVKLYFGTAYNKYLFCSPFTPIKV